MRDMTVDAQLAIEATYARPLFLVSCQFQNETIYVWTGVGSISWGGHTWIGVGALGSISTIAETLETQAQGITLSLSGIDNTLIADALTQTYGGGKAQVWLGFLLANGSLVSDPIPAYLGDMDQTTIDMSTDTTTISIAVENRLADLNRAQGGRYTDQCQRQISPTDSGFKFVSWLQDQFLNWRA